MNFEWTVTFGDILKLVGGAGFLGILLVRMDSRLKMLENWVAMHIECAKEQNKVLADVRSGLAFINGVLGRKTN